MTTNFVLKSPNADNTIDVANQIAAASIEGSKLANNTITSTQVDSSIALQSSLDAAIKGMSPKGSVRTILALAQLTGGGGTPTFTWNGGAQTLTTTTNLSLTGIPVAGVTDLADDDKILVTFSASDKQYSGVYVITDAGANDPGGSPVVLTRATNFNESAEVSFGAYVTIADGTYADQIWYLQTEGAITLNTTALTFAHWGETGASYTAGNGINISSSTISAKLKSSGGLDLDGAEIIVKVAASNALVKDGTSGELSVRTASDSVSGVITADQYNDLTRTVADSDVATITTTGNAYTDRSLSAVTVPTQSVGLYTLSMNSRNAANDKWSVMRVMFALRRETGDRLLVGDPLVVFHEHSANFGGIAVSVIPGTSAADSIRVTGISGEDITHYMTITMQTLANDVV